VADRIYSLDTLKGLALLFVFFIHVRWSSVGGPLSQELVGFTLMTFSRLAVPVFFLTSGYLLKMKLEKESNETSYCIRYLKKIGLFYVIGSFIFLFMKLLVFRLNRILEVDAVSTLELKLLGPEAFFHTFYSGKVAGEHLWFLLALFYSVTLIYLSYRYDVFEEIFGISIVLHLVAVLSRSYMVYDQLPIPQDDALFFGLFFTAAGFYLKKKEIGSMFTDQVLLRLAILANSLHLLERLGMTLMFESYTPYFWGNYSLFTAPAAITLFLYFLKKMKMGKNSRINTYGRNTLWIYILHPIMLAVILGIGGITTGRGVSFIVENIWLSMLVTLVAYLSLSEIVIRTPQGKIKTKIFRVSKSILKGKEPESSS
jgi:surface polysaccharide O-acyltransferase-like enzyme